MNLVLVCVVSMYVTALMLEADLWPFSWLFRALQQHRHRQAEALKSESTARVPWRGRGHRSLATVPLGFVDAVQSGRSSHRRSSDTGNAGEGADCHGEDNVMFHRAGGSLPSLRWRAALLAREGVWRLCRVCRVGKCPFPAGMGIV